MPLHLFHQPAQEASTTLPAILSAGLGSRVDERVWVLGNSELKRQVLTAGVQPERVIGVPWGMAMLGLPAVRYQLQQLENEPTLIHAWSLGALTLAMMLRPRVPRVLTVAQPMSRGQVHALRFLLTDERAPTAILCSSHTLQRDLLAGGVPERAVHVLHPGIDLGWVQHAQRAELRRNWGVESASTAASISNKPIVSPSNEGAEKPPLPPGESKTSPWRGWGEGVAAFGYPTLQDLFALRPSPSLAPGGSATLSQGERGFSEVPNNSNPNVSKPLVIGLLADPVWSVDARRLALIVGLAEEALRPRNVKLHVVIHPRQMHLPRARKTLEQVNKGYQFIIDNQADEPWAVLPGCDLALAMGPKAGGLSTRWGMAGNVPMVGEATYAQCEVLEDRHSALLVKPGDSVHLARRIAQVVTDSQLAWKLRDTARHEAFSYFSKVRYGQSLQQVYQQVISGQQVQVPAMTSTGGLRFEAGR